MRAGQIITAVQAVLKQELTSVQALSNILACEARLCTMAQQKGPKAMRADTLLLLPAGWQHVYIYYIAAILALEEQKFERYQVLMQLFSSAAEEYFTLYGNRSGAKKISLAPRYRNLQSL
ncbi:MAG: hypothetical protein PHG02_04900 [Oscillospiraceae bacterium]|nr:hypothetical protein [Oscillospiraceae bacterium]